MTILERLFGAGELIRLLRFCLFHPDEDFTVNELTQRLQRQHKKTAKNLRDLVTFGCITAGVRSGTGVKV